MIGVDTVDYSIIFDDLSLVGNVLPCFGKVNECNYFAILKVAISDQNVAWGQIIVNYSMLVQELQRV